MSLKRACANEPYDESSPSAKTLSGVALIGGPDFVWPFPLDRIAHAAELNDLRTPFGNHLEALGGDRKGQHSIRINDKYRICFRWVDGAALDVEIIDYH